MYNFLHTLFTLMKYINAFIIKSNTNYFLRCQNASFRNFYIFVKENTEQNLPNPMIRHKPQIKSNCEYFFKDKMSVSNKEINKISYKI